MRSAVLVVIALSTIAVLADPAAADDCHSRIMIVLDRSCSMNDPPTKGGSQTKWELAGLALQTVTTKYQGQLDFGLIMFPDQTGMSCLQDGPIYVNVAPGQESTVVSTVMSTMPTGPCVTDIKPAIDQVSTDPVFAAPYSGGARSFVLFISDGMQTCGGDATQIAASFKTLYDNGYPSYIVGFGDGVAPAALDSFATAGGVPRTPGPDGGTRLYYQADDEQSLDDALDHIVGTVTAEFTVCPGVPCPDNRCFAAGAQCQAGFCTGGASSDDGGASSSGDGGAASSGDGGSSSSGDGGAVSSGDGGEITKGHSKGGCGCRMTGSAPAGSALLFTALVCVAWSLRRRREVEPPSKTFPSG